MKRIYYIIADTTLVNSDPQKMNFYETNPLNDISGMLRMISNRNKTPIDKLRLYICPDKKTWEQMYKDNQRNLGSPI